MKVGCILLSLILLSIFLQISVAVICGRVKGACVTYQCSNNNSLNANGFPNNIIAVGVGCSTHFFQDCAEFVKEIDFIKNHNKNNIEYFNGYAQRFEHFEKIVKDNGHFKLGEVIWNSADGTTHRLDASGAEIKNDPNSTESNTQNNAINIISIFVLIFYVFIC
uniref:Uncharacterized protein n=1 Tax=Panagrolaimus davidi TaxID=227884 RepID=A0A914PIC6_9BILA